MGGNTNLTRGDTAVTRGETTCNVKTTTTTSAEFPHPYVEKRHGRLYQLQQTTERLFEIYGLTFSEIELTMLFPCTHLSPASTIGNLEESIMNGTCHKSRASARTRVNQQHERNAGDIVRTADKYQCAVELGKALEWKVYTRELERFKRTGWERTHSRENCW